MATNEGDYRDHVHGAKGRASGRWRFRLGRATVTVFAKAGAKLGQIILFPDGTGYWLSPNQRSLIS